MPFIFFRSQNLRKNIFKTVINVLFPSFLLEQPLWAQPYLHRLPGLLETSPFSSAFAKPPPPPFARRPLLLQSATAKPLNRDRAVQPIPCPKIMSNRNPRSPNDSQCLTTLTRYSLEIAQLSETVPRRHRSGLEFASLPGAQFTVFAAPLGARKPPDRALRSTSQSIPSQSVPSQSVPSQSVSSQGVPAQSVPASTKPSPASDITSPAVPSPPHRAGAEAVLREDQVSVTSLLSSRTSGTEASALSDIFLDRRFRRRAVYRREVCGLLDVADAPMGPVEQKLLRERSASVSAVGRYDGSSSQARRPVTELGGDGGLDGLDRGKLPGAEDSIGNNGGQGEGDDSSQMLGGHSRVRSLPSATNRRSPSLPANVARHRFVAGMSSSTRPSVATSFIYPRKPMSSPTEALQGPVRVGNIVARTRYLKLVNHTLVCHRRKQNSTVMWTELLTDCEVRYVVGYAKLTIVLAAGRVIYLRFGSENAATTWAKALRQAAASSRGPGLRHSVH